MNRMKIAACLLGMVMVFAACQESKRERMEREAMDRFHSWSNGMMDPAEEEVYTNAVKECAGKLRKESA